MKKPTTKLLYRVKIVAVVYAAVFFLLFFGMFLMANRPLPPGDKITIALMGVYIIGLLLGLKWQILGGLLIFIFPVYHFVELFRYSWGTWSEYSNPVLTLAFILIMLVPGVLYLLAWYSGRRTSQEA